MIICVHYSVNIKIICNKWVCIYKFNIQYNSLRDVEYRYSATVSEEKVVKNSESYKFSKRLTHFLSLLHKKD